MSATIIFPDNKTDDAPFPTQVRLEADGFKVCSHANASDILKGSATKLGILNLMESRIGTEINISQQIYRALKLSNASVIDLKFYRPTAFKSEKSGKDLAQEISHFDRFYELLEDVSNTGLDGLIITGHNPAVTFEREPFLAELKSLFDYAADNINLTTCICSAAQMALYHRYGATRSFADKKLTGIFKQTILDTTSPLMQGITRDFDLPVSRNGCMDENDYLRRANLKTLAMSAETGASIIKDDRFLYVTGHFEYDDKTLKREFNRDTEAHNKRPHFEIAPQPPENYDLENPQNTWKDAGDRFFANQINLMCM